ncbi:MAG TPA: molybdate ABC transporter substrate-binding protein [Blastocatellia bacterium]|nr:molybdate ABC transporter substrate-binding protein [Blastocatellia bacterium]
MKRPARAVCLAFALSLISSCGRPVAKSNELTVAAAADLQPALNEIAKSFETETGTTVVISYGSSGNLTQQIENGAPFDVFAAANVSFVDSLVNMGLVDPATKRVYAQGQITLWQRKDSKIQVSSLADLAKPEVNHVAIANPEHAPYGIAAIQALKSSGAYDQVKPKLVYAENIAETLQFAESGNADAAIVARAISDRPDGKWTAIDGSLHQPINQAVCIIKASRKPVIARQFLDFLNKPEALAVLKRYGFTIPGER